MPEVFDRPAGQLLGLDLSAHPFSSCPSFQPLKTLPLERKVHAMRDPSLRARLLTETPIDAEYFRVVRVRNVETMFELGDPPNYEPSPEQRLGVRARAAGVEPLEFAYDLLLKNQGRGIIYNPLSNFEGMNFDAVLTMMKHPDTIICLGDGGAHYGSICDASYSTYLLTHWTRDRSPGERLPLEWAIHSLTQRPAHAFGMRDRGCVAVGLKADLNVIDYDRLQLGLPHPRYDLPAGGRRLYQEATGYDATIVSGVITRRDGFFTGALPGRFQPAYKFMV
jgi:N-acyl-D-aspartate/D-glutamate deacylase